METDRNLKSTSLSNRLLDTLDKKEIWLSSCLQKSAKKSADSCDLRGLATINWKSVIFSYGSKDRDLLTQHQDIDYNPIIYRQSSPVWPTLLIRAYWLMLFSKYYVHEVCISKNYLLPTWLKLWRLFQHNEHTFRESKKSVYLKFTIIITDSWL